jgi:hypothetical protein
VLQINQPFYGKFVRLMHGRRMIWKDNCRCYERKQIGVQGHGRKVICGTVRQLSISTGQKARLVPVEPVPA